MIPALTLIPALSLAPVVSPPDLIDHLLPQPDCQIETARFVTEEAYALQNSVETLQPVTELPKYSEEYGTITANTIYNSATDFITNYTPGNGYYQSFYNDENDPSMYYFTSSVISDEEPFVYNAEITETDSSWIIDWDEPSSAQLFNVAQEQTHDNLLLHDQIHHYIEAQDTSDVFDSENNADYETKLQIVNKTCEHVAKMIDYQITSSPYMGDTLQSGTGQCIHYATIFSTIAREYGLESSLQRSHTHVWSVVAVDGIPLAYDPTGVAAAYSTDQYTGLDPTNYLAYRYTQNILPGVNELINVLHRAAEGDEDPWQISG